ncbi:MAG: DNA-binding response regulator [Haliscomenobacteraceae bacterium CHB4]|nr:Transcriptional regulatory protein BtsR [Saprospiraceae bacterium]MCE7924457.1 DNA-binding response regulator [Haliscomenobacteraceae bacterium CHB4]
MTSLNCLIVEDEPLAATILEDYVRQIPYLRLTGRCADALQALEALREAPVDVLFLDINLPGLKGLDFLRSLQYPPQVILTTAYHEYALESYDLGVVDYLLKPIDFERFIKAVQKLKRPGSPAEALAKAGRPFQFFNVNKKMVRVWLDEIQHVESLKEYVRIFLPGGRSIVTKMQLGELERSLEGFGFLRVHRSFIVALRHIEAFTATEVTAGGTEIPVGRQYKEEVARALENLSGG